MITVTVSSPIEFLFFFNLTHSNFDNSTFIWTVILSYRDLQAHWKGSSWIEPLMNLYPLRRSVIWKTTFQKYILVKSRKPSKIMRYNDHWLLFLNLSLVYPMWPPQKIKYLYNTLCDWRSLGFIFQLVY